MEYYNTSWKKCSDCTSKFILLWLDTWQAKAIYEKCHSLKTHEKRNISVFIPTTIVYYNIGIYSGMRAAISLYKRL